MTSEELKSKIPKRTLSEVLALHDKRELVGPMFLSNKDYHAAPGLSKSSLDLIETSPLYYTWCLKNPDDLSKSLIIGSGWHSLLLKDEPIDSIIYITKTQPTDPKRDDQGRAPLSEKNFAMIKAMADTFAMHPIAPRIIDGALIEVSFFWTDKDTGILCKCKPDIWRLNECLLADAKSAEDISDRPLKRAIKQYRYHVQAAFFIDGVRNSLDQAGIDIGNLYPTRFALIAQEKDEPYDIGLRPIGPRTLVTGEMEYRKNLETYADCVRTGVWPGKSGPKFKEIELEAYDLKDWENV